MERRADSTAVGQEFPGRRKVERRGAVGSGRGEQVQRGGERKIWEGKADSLLIAYK